MNLICQRFLTSLKRNAHTSIDSGLNFPIFEITDDGRYISQSYHVARRAGAQHDRFHILRIFELPYGDNFFLR